MIRRDALGMGNQDESREFDNLVGQEVQQSGYNLSLEFVRNYARTRGKIIYGCSAPADIAL